MSKYPEWDRENMGTLVTKVKKPIAEAFRAYATAHDTTVSRLLSDFVKRTLEGGEAVMTAENAAVNTGKEKTAVLFNIWASTYEKISAIAEAQHVDTSDLVNGILCEFIAGWTK